MDHAQPTNGTASVGARSLEAVLSDVEALTRELIEVAGPGALEALAGGGGLSGIGSRLSVVSPLLRTVCTQLDVLRMTWLSRIEADGMWALDGSRTFRTWLARQEKVTMRTASREVLTGQRLLECLPATLAAVLDGRIGMDQVRVMVDGGPTSEERRKALLAPVPTTPADETPDQGDDPPGGPTDHPTDSAGDAPTGGPAVPPTGEEVLLGLADQHGPLVLRRFVDRFARVADPDADERGYKKASEREHLDLAKTFGGYHLDGFLTDEHGEALRTAMHSVMGTPTPGEDRTPTQRRAQALADLARKVLDTGTTGTGAGIRPHLNVTVSWTELTRLTTQHGKPTCDSHDHTTTHGNSDPREHTGDCDGAGGCSEDRDHGEASNGATSNSATSSDADAGGGNDNDALFDAPTRPDTPVRPAGPATLTTLTAAPARYGISATLVPPDTLRRLLCDCTITRIVFGPDGQVLDVGRAQRTVTGQMRRAVITRDQHCVYPDCTQPPTHCEVHHAERHWAHGGETSIHNSALLCWHHHTLVDTTHITMRWTGNPHGTHHSGWTLTNRHGNPITPTRRPDTTKHAA